MRAVFVDAPGDLDALVIKDVPDPQPGPEDVLIEVAYAGCNWADTQIRSGIYPYPPDYPCVPGFEISGKAGTKIPAPAMAYNIGQFNLILNPKSGAGYQGAVPDKLSLSVAEGKETTLPLPKTLISTFAISQGSGTVRFSVALADDAGSRNVTLTKFGKKTPPEIEVLDKAGKVVHTGRLEYG